MASPILLAICTAVILYRVYRYMFERPENFPPGPPKVPILGSYPFLLLANYKHMHRATETLARWYRTPVLGFYYASVPSVTVHDMATTKEVLNNPDMDGRPVFELVRARDPAFDVWGIFFRDGPAWKEQRRFTLRHLRDYGFGRRFDVLESHINEQLLSFVDLVKNGPKFAYERELVSDDGVVELPLAFAAHPANLFLKCVLNECFDREELGVLFRAGRAAFRFQRNACMYGRLFSMVSCLRWIAPGVTGYTAVRESSMELHAIIKAIVDKELQTFDASHERHFLDLYFRELQNADGAESTFHLKQLTHAIIDFIFPALTAVGSTMSFALQRLLMNPDCMARVQRELDDVVGRGRLPQLDDRIHMPYLEASLRESMRLDTLVANNVPHQALRDTKVGGYDLPKGGLCVLVLQSAHTDERAFREALVYRPERFLAANGALHVRLDKSLPFGAGKRLCAGETFARNMLFLYVAAILQNFDLSVPAGETLPDPSLETQTTGTIKSPPDFRLRFTSR